MSAASGAVVKQELATLSLRHQPSGLNTCFKTAAVSFPEYIEQCRSIIMQSRPDLNGKSLDKIIAGNSPFELVPAAAYPAGKKKAYRRGILLTHGLSDSPYFMRHLAGIFQENGFRVMALLLPGHGTRPGDLLDVHWSEWQKSVAYGVDQLSREVDEVYLGGYSAGATLSIHQSLHDARVRGLFLFAPALKISPKAAFANFHKSYSWMKPAAQWLTIKPDLDEYKYESFPKNAAAQMYALTQALHKSLNKREVNIPIFAVTSQDDVTVRTAAAVDFMLQASHPANKLVYYFSNAATIPQGFSKDRFEAVDSVFPEQKILGSAHTAIVLPPEDSYYGECGAYNNCAHYYPLAIDKYAICNTQPGEIWSGEITRENLRKHTLRRLMYNPNFLSMKLAMGRFIDNLPV